MDRSMVIGKLQYVQVQMLLGNRALCKYVIFSTESALPTYTGCCKGCINRDALKKMFVFKRS